MIGGASPFRVAIPAGFFCKSLSSSSFSQAAHVRLTALGAAEIGMGSHDRITRSATASASDSSGSLIAPTTSLNCSGRFRG
jgi:hypothetical protein